MCQESETTLEIDGGSGMVEFKSGATASPYLYVGFRAVVQFIHTGALVPSTETTLLPSSRSNGAGRGINVSNKLSGGGGKYRRPAQPQPPRRTIPPIIQNGYDDEEDEDEEDEEEYTDEPVMAQYPRAPYGAYFLYFQLKFFIRISSRKTVYIPRVFFGRCQRCSSNKLRPHF